MQPRFIALLLALPSLAWGALQPPASALSALKDKSVCHWNTSQGSDCTTQQTFTILQDAGRDLFGSQVIHAGEQDTLDILEAYTLQPDGTRLDVSPRDMQAVKNPSQNGFNGDRSITIAYPKVGINSQLVLKYRLQAPRRAPFTALSYNDSLPAMPVRIDNFDLTIYADTPLYVRQNNFTEQQFAVQASDSGKTMRLTLREPIYRYPDEKHARLALRQTPQYEISTAPTPEVFLAPWGEKVAQRMTAPLPEKARKQVDQVKGLPVIEQMARLLEDVNQRIRYMGDWRETINGFVPFPLDEIEQRGFGDCKDMAITLAAMLRAAGLDARIALVRADLDNTPFLLTPLNYVNHAIVAVKVDDQTYWLDPTQPYNTLGTLPATLQDRPAFVLAPDGRIETQHIPRNNASTSHEWVSMDLFRQSDHRWTMQAERTLSGILASEQANEELTDGKAVAEQSLINDLLFGDMTASKPVLTRGKWSHLLTTPYRYQAQAEVGQVTTPIGNLQQVDLRIYDSLIKLAREYQALHGVSDFRDMPRSLHYLTRLHGVRPQQLPAACHVNSPWLDYSLTPVRVDDGLGIEQRAVRKAFWISGNELNSEAFGAMVEALAACDSQAQLLLAP